MATSGPAAAPVLPDHVDVVVVGAGLSGIGAGYRLQTECPDRDYLILEGREAMGGTWDLFRYPGVRSDSDMFTLGYPFKAWASDRSLADGESILDYIRETAAEFGIDERIRYSTRVEAADFDTETARWTLRLTTPDGERSMTCDFLYACAGYYDYEQPYDPGLPGIEDFGGQVVHPQFWPEDLDYAGKRVVVVGSGATAVTLVPSMAGEAEHVTMLQRTPTWIASVPRRDKWAGLARKVLPAGLAHQAMRTKNILFTIGFYEFCQRQPARARAMLTKLNGQKLDDQSLLVPHFSPPYDPWDQRLCAVPGGDLFRALNAGTAEIVTDHIDTFVPEGVRLQSGRVLEADIVITATGLQLRAFGGITPSVDGVEVPMADQFIWNYAMLTGVPNFAICVGYTNASWTLRADLTSRLVCRVLNFMREGDYAAVEPKPDRELRQRPLLDLASGYVARDIDAFPKQGDSGPWRVRQNYVIDAAQTLRRDLRPTLTVTPRSKVRRGGAPGARERAAS